MLGLGVGPPNELSDGVTNSAKPVNSDDFGIDSLSGFVATRPVKTDFMGGVATAGWSGRFAYFAKPVNLEADASSVCADWEVVGAEEDVDNASTFGSTNTSGFTRVMVDGVGVEGSFDGFATELLPAAQGEDEFLARGFESGEACPNNAEERIGDDGRGASPNDELACRTPGICAEVAEPSKAPRNLSDSGENDQPPPTKEPLGGGICSW